MYGRSFYTCILRRHRSPFSLSYLRNIERRFTTSRTALSKDDYTTSHTKHSLLSDAIAVAKMSDPNKYTVEQVTPNDIIDFWFRSSRAEQSRDVDFTAVPFTTIQLWFGIQVTPEDQKEIDQDIANKFGHLLDIFASFHTSDANNTSSTNKVGQERSKEQRTLGEGKDGVNVEFDPEEHLWGSAADMMVDLHSRFNSPDGRLAQIIILDQFPRNIYRKTARAFSYDTYSLKLSKRMIESGEYDTLANLEQLFARMPLQHSENLAHQDLNCKLEGDKVSEYSLQHREIIKKYGRYPYRNIVLGRKSTPEEHEFLNGEHPSFGQ